MDGNSPYPPGFGPPPPGNGPPPGPVGPGYAPQPPANFGPPSPSAPRRRSGLLASGVALAVLLGIAALVLSIIGLTRGLEPQAATPTSEALPQELFVDEADKSLCEAIAPLMREESERGKAFIKSDPDSPERKAAIPTFRSETLEWAGRIQTVLNEHGDPPRYLTRTLQQYIDGMLLYSENLHEDRAPDPYDNTAYEAAIIAVGGPLATCYKVGVKW